MLPPCFLRFECSWLETTKAARTNGTVGTTRTVGSSRLLVKIPAGDAGGLAAEARSPEFFGDQMHNFMFYLKFTGDAKKARRLGQSDVLFEDSFPEYDVDKAGFVFQRHENHAARGTWPLPADNEAGITDTFSVRHRSNGARVRQSLCAKLRTPGFERMAPRAVRGRTVVPQDLFESIQRCEGGIFRARRERQRVAHERQPLQIP